MKLSAGRIIFFGIIAFALVVCIISGVLGTRLIGKPFRGFPLNEFFRIGAAGISDWTGLKAGLKVGDKIIAINGKDVSSITKVHKIADETEVGTPITYTVLRGKQLFKVDVPTMRFRFIDLLIIFMIPFIVGLILLLTGIVVYFLKPDTKVSWVFMLACLLLGLYIIPNFDIILTHFGFVRFSIFTISFIPACFIHLWLIFPEPLKVTQKYPYIQWIPYIISSILFLVLELAYPGDIYWHTMDIAQSYIIMGAAAIVIKALYDYLKVGNVIRKERAKVILLGTSVAFPIPTFLLLAPFIFSSFYSIPGGILALPLTIFPASIAYAIIKHNLFDVDVIIKRTVGYVMLTSIIVGFYALTTVIFNVFLGRYEIARSRLFPIIFTLIIILIFNPLRNKIQSFVDKVFFRKEYNYQEMVGKISEAMRSLMDLDQIVDRIIGTVMGAMFLDAGSVMLLNKKAAEYEVCATGGERWDESERKGLRLALNDPLIRSIAERKKEITLYDIQEDPRYKKEKEKCLKAFKTLNASLLIPMVYEEQLSGLISLGNKKSGKFFTREDINLLRTLANQSAVAIENARLFKENLEKKRLEETYSRYISKTVVDEIIKDPEKLSLGGAKRELSILFSDIRNFTSVSEQLKPEALVQLLNEYLSFMTEIVFKYGGLLDKYIGDAIMAVYGAPLPQDDHPYRACLTALEMIRALKMLQAKWTEATNKTLNIGIGINTGEVIVGNMGSERRFDYTVVGDHVNLASRLESLNKFYGTNIILSEFTYQFIKDNDKGLICHELDLIRVKGKAEPVRIYQMFDKEENNLKEAAQIFEEGIILYRNRNWDKAISLFEKVKRIMPEDKPVQIYLERCNFFKQQPPHEDWDGVFVMREK